MEKLIKIQSMSDIITNSSSEVFIIETVKTWQEVQEEIKSWGLEKDEDGSGMGQYCEVFDNKRHYPGEAFDFGEPLFPWLGKNHLAIDIDWSRKKTIDRIFKEMSEIVNFETAKKIGKMYEEYQYAVIALDEIESERKDREENRKIDNEEQEKES
jgi:hypothetical protein